MLRHISVSLIKYRKKNPAIIIIIITIKYMFLMSVYYEYRRIYCSRKYKLNLFKFSTLNYFYSVTKCYRVVTHHSIENDFHSVTYVCICTHP